MFTATPDLTAEFPAYAARLLGMTDVPLLCATEIAVPGAMPRVLRLLAHVETDRSRAEIAASVPARGGRAAPGPAAVASAEASCARRIRSVRDGRPATAASGDDAVRTLQTP